VRVDQDVRDGRIVHEGSIGPSRVPRHDFGAELLLLFEVRGMVAGLGQYDFYRSSYLLLS